MKSYQTIVLSGGGSKGPYGLGVLLALEKYHIERKKNDLTKIYCGTSVGALNATLAAQNNLKQLSQLYSNLRTKDILGTDNAQVGRLKMLGVVNRKPFHYFKNSALKSTIEKYADFTQLHDAHLLICATNYTNGELETFYTSSLVDEFLNEEQSHPDEKRRLHNYHRIESQSDLVEALLASTAIPFYLPPIQVDKSIYVDGGVGNNTPLRQAAYICRFLSCRSDVSMEPTFCVINDPSRFKIGHAESNDIFGVIRRTMDIVHNELVNDSYISWERINKEVQRSQERANILASHIEGLEELSPDARAALKERVESALQATSTSTPRRDLPIMIVRPNTRLVENMLHFDPKVSKSIKEHGVADCLSLLQHKNFITPNDFRRWNEQID